MKDLTDEQLMERVVNGDHHAFATLHSRHDKLVRGHIAALCGFPSMMDDIAQRAWWHIWQSAPRYNQSKGRVAGWISSIAKNKAIDVLREGVCRERIMDRFTDALQSQWLPQRDIETRDASDELQSKEFLAAAKALLPPAQWEVIELCFVQGRTQREVVEVTGVALSTIKTRWELALRKLREFLKQQDLPCARTIARDTRPSIRSATIVPVRASGNGHTRRSRQSGRAGAPVPEGRAA